MSDLKTNLQTILNEKNNKIIPENIKKDIQIFDIIGTYEGSGGTTVEGVKQFSTIEEMHLDSTAQEGDLAVVYRNEIQNANVNSVFSKAIFPATVVLSTAITDYVQVRYRAVDGSMFDCWGQLDSSNFMMDCYTEIGSIRIEYTSSDGITYTRTDGGEEIVDFGIEIKYSYPNYWNDAIGYFMQVSSTYFGGLFEYKINLPNKDIIAIYDTTSIAITDTSVKEDTSNLLKTIELSKLKAVRDAIIADTTLSLYNNRIDFFLNSDNELQFATFKSGNNYFGYLDTYTYLQDGTFLGVSPGFSTPNINIYTVNLEECSYNLTTSITTATAIKPVSNMTFVYIPVEQFDINSFNVSFNSEGDIQFSRRIYVISSETDASVICSKSGSAAIETCYKLENKYLIAPTQLTLKSANELLPGKMTYGKDGLIEGDGSIWDEIPTEILYEELYQLKSIYVNGTNKVYGVSENDIYDLPLSTYDVSGKLRPVKILDTFTDNSICMCTTLKTYLDIRSIVPETYWSYTISYSKYIPNKDMLILVFSHDYIFELVIVQGTTVKTQTLQKGSLDIRSFSYYCTDDYLMYYGTSTFSSSNPVRILYRCINLDTLDDKQVIYAETTAPNLGQPMQNIFVLAAKNHFMIMYKDYLSGSSPTYRLFLRMYNPSTNTIKSLINSLPSSSTNCGYDVNDFGDYMYLSVYANTGSATECYRFKIIGDDFTVARTTLSSALNITTSKRYSCHCTEDDTKIYDYEYGYVKYKTPTLTDNVQKVNVNGVSEIYWNTTHDLFEMNVDNKLIVCKVNDNPEYAIDGNGMTFNHTKLATIPLYFGALYQKDGSISYVNGNLYNTSPQLNTVYIENNKLYVTNSTSVTTIINKYEILPCVEDDDYDYLVLKTQPTGQKVISLITKNLNKE